MYLFPLTSFPLTYLFSTYLPTYCLLFMSLGAGSRVRAGSHFSNQSRAPGGLQLGTHWHRDRIALRPSIRTVGLELEAPSARDRFLLPAGRPVPTASTHPASAVATTPAHAGSCWGRSYGTGTDSCWSRRTCTAAQRSACHCTGRRESTTHRRSLPSLERALRLASFGNRCFS